MLHLMHAMADFSRRWIHAFSHRGELGFLTPTWNNHANAQEFHTHLLDILPHTLVGHVIPPVSSPQRLISVACHGQTLIFTCSAHPKKILSRLCTPQMHQLCNENGVPLRI
jgi:hypothetical protein